MGWHAAPVPRLHLPALGRPPAPCGAARCPRRHGSRWWHRAVLQGAGAGSAFCEPQLVSQRQGTSICSQIPLCIFVVAKSRKLLARWLLMGTWQVSCEPLPGGLQASWGFLCSSCWERCWLHMAGSGGLEHTGLHQGEGGGNKRDEEGALNSIDLQKEAAVRKREPGAWGERC